MNNKNDWEELERWNTQRIINEKEKSKFYYEKFDKSKNVDTLVKGLKVTGGVFKLITFIIILIVVFISATLINVYLSNLRGRVTIDVVPTIQNMYGTKVKIISKDIDKEDNGIYKLQVKNNKEIQFTAIKDGNSLQEDFLDRTHQYYFNKWNSNNKERFKIKESINNEILEYDTYIEINNFEEIEETVNTIFEFKEFCNEKFFSMWHVYLLKENKRIYPYQSNTMLKEDAINYAKELYDKYFKVETYKTDN